MRNLVRVAVAALNQIPFGWQNNVQNILSAIDAARGQGVTLLLLPELCITGYGVQDAFFGTHVTQRARAILGELLPKTAGMVVSVGLPIVHNRKLYNSAVLLVDGKVAGVVCKQHLAGDGIHYEPRWFAPWPEGERATCSLVDGESAVPMGDLHFDVGGIKIGFEICEDAWVADRPGAGLAQAGVDMILNPSASHFAFGKTKLRTRLVEESSRSGALAYLYANLLGNEDGRAIYDGDCMIAALGEVAARTRRFSFSPFELAVAVVDFDRIRRSAERTTSFETNVEDDPACVKVAFRWPENQSRSVTKLSIEAWENSPRVKEEEFARAVSLGLWDYLRKNRLSGFLVSLSGGKDSSSVALLVYLAARFATQELSPEAVRAALPTLAYLVDADRKINPAWLTCLYQSTRNSSKGTESCARFLSELIGARFGVLDVDPMFQSYQQATEKFLGEQLCWEKHDLTLQNLQARSRSPGAWAVANALGQLFLVTSNRSEASVGYCTMDGDTSGGLNPIGGINKSFIAEWLEWMETAGPLGIGPMPGLRAVNAQVPTAELRPQDQHQTDEADLMPYTVLNSIESLAIREWEKPLEVYLQLLAEFSGTYAATQLAGWVTRFFQLWVRNQWKRERFALSFHLDDRNVDPKTWCRFPNISGGFEEELAELERYVKSSNAEK